MSSSTADEAIKEDKTSTNNEIEASNEENNAEVEDDEEVSLTFPQLLMQILSNPDYKDIISWLPNGRAFVIRRKQRFISEVLAKYFPQSKFTSFTRKLNRWGFSRASRGPEAGSYHHKLFLRDQPDQCLDMRCKRSPSHQEPVERPGVDTFTFVNTNASVASPLAFLTSVPPPVATQYAASTAAIQALTAQNALLRQQQHHLLMQLEEERKVTYLQLLQASNFLAPTLTNLASPATSNQLMWATREVVPETPLSGGVLEGAARLPPPSTTRTRKRKGIRKAKAA